MDVLIECGQGRERDEGASLMMMKFIWFSSIHLLLIFSTPPQALKSENEQEDISPSSCLPPLQRKKEMPGHLWKTENQIPQPFFGDDPAEETKRRLKNNNNNNKKTAIRKH